ncbi:DUF1353 domain-containing protein [Candidatus Pacearchaeota archaeon]|nr:DUF1353 domain-containing protein [Candidatus Pacearchaeota archaeon]
MEMVLPIFMPMPKVQPLPIKTLHLKWYKAIWVWMTQPRRWKLLEDYVIEIPGYGFIMVPAGFIFDGASIPRMFWTFLSPTGLLFIPGIFHDYGYKYNKLFSWVGTGYMANSGYSRKFWDDMFLHIANHINGMAPVNKTAWAAVRAGAWNVWRKYRNGSTTETR